MADPVLELRGIEKRFGALTVARDIALTIQPGEIHALIGPNGAGKTSLVKQVSGMLAPDAGQILFHGRDVTDMSAAARARLGMARTFQVSATLLECSLIDNTLAAAIGRQGAVYRFWRAARHDAARFAIASEALARVGLAQRAADLAAQLSHGERRQLELAMALASTPELLLLDEPLAGLGLDGGQRIVELLAGLRGTVTMLLIEHDMDAVFALADRISVMVDGAVLATGTPAEIRDDTRVQQAYLGTEAVV